MNKRTNTTRAWALLLSLLLVLGVFAGCGTQSSSSAGSAPASSTVESTPASSAVESAPASSAGDASSVASANAAETKNITLKVVHKDGSEKEFAIETDADNLRAALEQEKLVEGDESDYGLYVKTVDGETVDEANQEWWCLTKGGEMTTTGVDDTKIADGEAYEFTFTVGY